MRPSPQYIVALVFGALLYIGIAWVVDRSVTSRIKPWVRFAAIGGAIFGFFQILRVHVDDYSRTVDYSKIAISAAAILCVYYEAQRNGMKRPISERWKKFVGVALGIAA